MNIQDFTRLYILHFNLSKALFSISFGVQVKVVLRVNPKLPGDQGQPPVLWTDPSKKRVTIMEPVSMKQPHSTMTLGRDGKNFLKTFNFDAAYNQESNQVWFLFLITVEHNLNMVSNLHLCLLNTDLHNLIICFALFYR